MENVCYVCGAVGYEELLVTCSKCEGASIHEYCMKTLESHVPNEAMWVCEECEETPKHGARKFSNGAPSKRKTEIISTDEAIALASQSSLSKVTGKRHLASPEKAYKKVEICKKRVENVTNVVPSLGDLRVCSADKPSTLPSAGKKRYKKPPVHASIPSAVPGPSSKQKSCIENFAHARTPLPISKPSPELRSSKESSAHAHSASTKLGLGFAQGGTPCKDTLKTSDNAGEKRLSDKQLTIDRHLPNHPASSATWKGTLGIGGYDTPVGSCTDVWGYPPSKVGKKAFKFSKKMPGSLHFEPIPRSAVWGNKFNDRGPDKFDIGLYFLPNGDRSEQCYSLIVSYLEKQDIVLRCFVSGTQLLIFSSSHLDEESKKINQAYYLWGLFLPPVITCKEPAQNQNEGTAGMEIDVPDSSGSHPSCSKTSKATASASQPACEIQLKPEKWDMEDLASLPESSARAAWVEPRVPPGFERVTTWVEPRVPPGFERVTFKTISEILQAGDD